MERLPEAVSKALSQLPEVSLCRVEYNTSAIDIGPDLEIALEVQGRPVSLLVELKMNAYPRDVRALVSQLDSYRAWSGKDTFYDRIIPRYFNKIGRKFGAQVGNVTIGTEKGKNGLTPWNRVKAEVPSIPITDSMRESVMHEGQPLFHKQGNIEHGSSDTDTGNGADSSREETDAATAGALGQAPQGVRRRLAGRTPSYARSMVSGNQAPNKITAADGIGAFDPRSADILKQRRVAPTF